MQIKIVKKKILSFILIFFPLMAVLVVTPIVIELPLIIWPENLVHVFVMTPFYLGLVALPGYIYFVLKNQDINSLSNQKQIWIGMSVVFGFLASLGGLISIFFVINIPFIIGSVISSIFVMIKFFKARYAK